MCKKPWPKWVKNQRTDHILEAISHHIYYHRFLWLIWALPSCHDNVIDISYCQQLCKWSRFHLLSWIKRLWSWWFMWYLLLLTAQRAVEKVVADHMRAQGKTVNGPDDNLLAQQSDIVNTFTKLLQQTGEVNLHFIFFFIITQKYFWSSFAGLFFTSAYMRCAHSGTLTHTFRARLRRCASLHHHHHKKKN